MQYISTSTTTSTMTMVIPRTAATTIGQYDVKETKCRIDSGEVFIKPLLGRLKELRKVQTSYPHSLTHIFAEIIDTTQYEQIFAGVLDKGGALQTKASLGKYNPTKARGAIEHQFLPKQPGHTQTRVHSKFAETVQKRQTLEELLRQMKTEEEASRKSCADFEEIVALARQGKGVSTRKATEAEFKAGSAQEVELLPPIKKSKSPITIKNEFKMLQVEEDEYLLLVKVIPTMDDAAIRENGIDIVLLNDNSGSMGNNMGHVTRHDVSVKASCNTIDSCNSRDRVAVFTFSNQNQCVVPGIVLFDKNQKEYAKSLVRQIVSNGSDTLNKISLVAAAKTLEEWRKINLSNRAQCVVDITDGLSNFNVEGFLGDPSFIGAMNCIGGKSASFNAVWCGEHNTSALTELMKLTSNLRGEIVDLDKNKSSTADDAFKGFIKNAPCSPFMLTEGTTLEISGGKIIDYYTESQAVAAGNMITKIASKPILNKAGSEFFVRLKVTDPQAKIQVKLKVQGKDLIFDAPLLEQTDTASFTVNQIPFCPRRNLPLIVGYAEYLKALTDLFYVLYNIEDPNKPRKKQSLKAIEIQRSEEITKCVANLREILKLISNFPLSASIARITDLLLEFEDDLDDLNDIVFTKTALKEKQAKVLKEIAQKEKQDKVILEKENAITRKESILANLTIASFGHDPEVLRVKTTKELKELQEEIAAIKATYAAEKKAKFKVLEQEFNAHIEQLRFAMINSLRLKVRLAVMAHFQPEFMTPLQKDTWTAAKRIWEDNGFLCADRRMLDRVPSRKTINQKGVFPEEETGHDSSKFFVVTAESLKQFGISNGPAKIVVDYAIGFRTWLTISTTGLLAYRGHQFEHNNMTGHVKYLPGQSLGSLFFVDRTNVFRDNDQAVYLTDTNLIKGLDLLLSSRKLAGSDTQHTKVCRDIDDVRKSILKHIISDQFVGDQTKYMTEEADKFIEKEERIKFLKSVQAQLNNVNMRNLKDVRNFIITQIICNKLIGESMFKFIVEHCPKDFAHELRECFCESVTEHLRGLSKEKLQQLRVAESHFQTWQKLWDNQ